MEILQKNKEILKKQRPQLLEELEKCLKEFTEEQRVIVQYDLKGNFYPAIMKDNREWHLNSRYDAEYAAVLYGKNHEDIKEYAVYYLFGFGDGRVVRQILKNMNDTNYLVIYEPDLEIFCRVLEYEDISDIIEDERCIIILEKVNEKKLESFIDGTMNYSNFVLANVLILPGYDVLYTKRCRYFIDLILYYKKKVVINRNTEMNRKMKLTENILHNMYDYTRQSDLSLLIEKIKEKDTDGMPAIIVSAGPSLDKNIKELKKAEGKAFIIGVDAALKALVRNGIQFQVGISVDPAKDMTLFEDERLEKIPMVLELYSTSGLVEKHRGRRFYSIGYGGEYLLELRKQMGDVSYCALRTGGSVATAAVALAEEMGFKTIILVGQDLAFTDGRGHVSSVCDDEEKNRKHLEERKLTEVEDINGNMVQTDWQMALYIEWFAKEAYNERDKIKIIDATEGGAKIANTHIMTLKEAIETECRNEADFNHMIQEVPFTFNEAEQDKMYYEFTTIPERLCRLRKKLEEDIESYRKFKELETEGITSSAEYNKLLQKVQDIDSMEKEESLMFLIAQYNRRVEYEATADIYTNEELKIGDIADRAIKILEGYIQSIEEFEKDLPILLNQLPV